MYTERIDDINHLKQNRCDTSDDLNRVREELPYRLDLCKAINGSKIFLLFGENQCFYLLLLLSCDISKVNHDFADTGDNATHVT